MDQEHLSPETNLEKPLKESVPEHLPRPESLSRPEQQEGGPEQLVKTSSEIEKKTEEPSTGQTASVVDITNQQSREEIRKKEVDNILSDGLADAFLNLDAEKQKEFKQAGEKTVNKINVLLSKTKVKVGQIVNLIKKWLGILPNANKYYLEQEAKIKADKIIQLKDKY